MPSVVFDVVGTCFVRPFLSLGLIPSSSRSLTRPPTFQSYDAGAEALMVRLGDKLEAQGVSCKLLFYSWCAVCSFHKSSVLGDHWGSY